MLPQGTLQCVWDIAASALESDPPLCLIPLLIRQMDLVEEIRQAIAEVDGPRALGNYRALLMCMGRIAETHAAEEARLEARLQMLHGHARTTAGELGWLLSRMTEAEDLGEEMEEALRIHAIANRDILGLVD